MRDNHAVGVPAALPPDVLGGTMIDKLEAHGPALAVEIFIVFLLYVIFRRNKT